MKNMNNSQIAILASMREELEMLLPLVKIHSKKIELNFPTWQGELNERKIIIQLTGIGKVNAAMSTQKLLSKQKISHIYNFGVAGGVSKKINIGDVIYATNTVQSDLDLTLFGFKKGQVLNLDKRYLPTFYKKSFLKSLTKKCPIKFGNVVSADQFIADRKTVLKIGQEFKALAKDMEAAAIGYVCYMNKVPLTVIKGICDNSGKFASDEFKKYLKLATVNCIKVLLELIKNQQSYAND
jgi:adenosylhomocysteine nucleosidase